MRSEELSPFAVDELLELGCCASAEGVNEVGFEFGTDTDRSSGTWVGVDELAEGFGPSLNRSSSKNSFLRSTSLTCLRPSKAACLFSLY